MEQSLIEKVYAFIDEVKASSDYQTLVKLHTHLNEDEEVKKASDNFKHYEAKYKEVKQYGNYHPDLKEVQKAFQNAKKELYSLTLVQDYKHYEKRLQTTLDACGEQITALVSPHLKLQGSLSFMHKGGSSCSVDKV